MPPNSSTRPIQFFKTMEDVETYVKNQENDDCIRGCMFPSSFKPLLTKWQIDPLTSTMSPTWTKQMDGTY